MAWEAAVEDRPDLPDEQPMPFTPHDACPSRSHPQPNESYKSERVAENLTLRARRSIPPRAHSQPTETSKDKNNQAVDDRSPVAEIDYHILDKTLVR